MPRQANIVSFDAARRAATGTRAPRRSGSGAGRVLIGGDQSAIADDLPMFSVRRPQPPASAASRRSAAPARTPSWYDGGSASRWDDEAVFARHAAPRVSRFADEDDAAANDEELERALERRGGSPWSRMRSRSAEKRRERTKERADRAYFRQYEAGKGSDAPAGGPRAAVYKGEMGSTHKRSSRMQQQTASGVAQGGKKMRGSGEKAPLLARGAFMGFAATMLCVAFGVAFLYGPAQQLYVDIRERDRLTAEYEAVVERNNAIGAEVSALQTEAGVEDVARTQFGWVREGEHAVSVSGLTAQKESSFRGNILSEDIELPDTWYSGVLDPFFGVS